MASRYTERQSTTMMSWFRYGKILVVVNFGPIGHSKRMLAQNNEMCWQFTYA
ncbi:MAG: hypothetical protein ACTS81_02220 [Arsenophonus sp. ER-BJ3-MAG3]